MPITIQISKENNVYSIESDGVIIYAATIGGAMRAAVGVVVERLHAATIKDWAGDQSTIDSARSTAQNLIIQARDFHS
tara:strand:+ start:86 stop:319 length:234 start_codon:yes stop_codon:yes gene_type:complete